MLATAHLRTMLPMSITRLGLPLSAPAGSSSILALDEIVMIKFGGTRDDDDLILLLILIKLK